MKELITIQSELKAPKSQFNKFGGYKYRKAEDILEAVKPLLAKQKCTLIISDDIVMIGNRIYVKATATIKNEKGECETTTGWAREEENKKGMDGSQITGASSSYARKYALNGLFAIDDNADSDTTNTGQQDNVHHQAAQQTAQTQQQSQAAAQPAIADERHPTTQRLLLDGLRGLTLRSHEQHQTSLSSHPLQVLPRPQDTPHGLAHVDDVNQIPPGIDVGPHLGVPAAGPVSEMYSRFDQVFYKNGSQGQLLFRHTGDVPFIEGRPALQT